MIKMTPFSHPLSELYPSVRPLTSVHFIVTFQELQNSIP